MAIGAERLMRIGAVNGIVSGVPGGFFNVEADSFVRTGKFDFDRERLGRSMYELSLFGGVLGLGSGLLARGNLNGQHGREHFAAIEGGKDSTLTGGDAQLLAGPVPGVDGMIRDSSAPPGFVQRLGNDFGVAHANQPESVDAQSPLEGATTIAYDQMPRGNEPELLSKIVSKEWTRESLIKAIEDGRKDFRQADLRGLVLSDIDFGKALLDGADFTGSRLSGVDFSKAASMARPMFFLRFKNAELDGVNFSKQDLRWADFSGAILAKVELEGADLRQSDFTGSELKDVDFSRVSNLMESKFEEANLEGTNFSELFLREGIFSRARNIKSANFDGTDLGRAVFTGCDLSHVDFTRVRSLRMAIFDHANLESANFMGHDLVRASFKNVILKNVNFERVNLYSNDFSDSVLSGVDFSKVQRLAGATFRGSDLAGAAFTGLNLNADFAGANDVHLANFNGANLLRSNFAGSDLALTDYFPPDSSVMRAISELGGGADNLTDIARFISMNPESHKLVLERELLRGIPLESLSAERFVSFVDFQSHYGHDSPEMKALTEVEHGRGFFSELSKFVELDPENNYNLVAREALKDGGPDRLSLVRLEALEKLQRYFENSPAELQQLLNLERSGTVSLHQISDFIQEHPESHKAAVLRELSQSAVYGAYLGQFAYSRLRALSSLGDWFGRDSDMMQSILRLEKEGLPLPVMSELLNQDPLKQSLVQTLIVKGAPAEQVLKALGDDSGSLAQHFSPEHSDYFGQLIDGRLRTGQLRGYIADNPLERIALVEELLRSKATLQRFHDQMSLSMLPDDVSRRILDGGKVRAPEIIGPMRNWHSGRYFRELLIEQVRAGESISHKEIEKLSVQARVAASQKDAAAQSGENVHKQDESDGNGLSTDQTSFRVTNPRAIEAAKIISEAVDEILKQIPEEKMIVVLGRDALPLYPALRNSGRNAQYFLWSRLQLNDERTKQQWRQEVGPESVVIDTGYAGSILDAIRGVDPTASAYLLSSLSEYPQLLKRHDHSAVVDNLEYFPKLVARSSTYTKEGGAVSRKGNIDEHDDTRTSRWTVESLNRQFLRAIGLDEWGVWRYSNFAGLTPAERLGVDTSEEVERHYAQVKASRNAAAADSSH